MSELNPAVPPAMERVVAKAMEKRPEKRYQSALEMAQDLQRALQEPDGTWLGRLPDRPQAVQDQQPVIHSTTRQMPVHSKNWLWTRISAIALAALVLFGLIFGTIKIYDQIVNITEAPYCLDEDEREALRMVARAGLKAEISRVSDSSKAAGTVVLQSPEYGSTMRKNETIFLTISTGPEEQPVPKITDMNVETARMELETVGFTLLALPERVLSNTPWDTVLSQSPAEGELLPSGGVVQVTLSGGSVILPDLTGKTRAEAMMLIQQYNLNLTEIKEIPVDDATQFERVAAQQYMDGNLNMYEPGQQAMQQTQVTLAIYVSSQPLPTEEAPAASEKADQEEEAT